MRFPFSHTPNPLPAPAQHVGCVALRIQKHDDWRIEGFGGDVEAEVIVEIGLAGIAPVVVDEPEAGRVASHLMPKRKIMIVAAAAVADLHVQRVVCEAGRLVRGGGHFAQDDLVGIAEAALYRFDSSLGCGRVGVRFFFVRAAAG